jgi:hypothetical protein
MTVCHADSSTDTGGTHSTSARHADATSMRRGANLTQVGRPACPGSAATCDPPFVTLHTRNERSSQPVGKESAKRQ